MAHTASAPTPQQHYHVPPPMAWPIMGSMALFLMAVGATFVFNDSGGGWMSIVLGFILLLYMMFRWFGAVIRESEGGMYGAWEDQSFRWGMSWFIFSEVMFFFGFFAALFWARVMSVPDLSSLLHSELLWPGFKDLWPSAGPGFAEEFTPMGAWGVPALNTLLLLSSGITLTYAHWGVVHDQRVKLNLFLFLTILLGVAFLGLQIFEYGHAYSQLNLKLTTGVYGTTFFMLTGFHGFHVTLGTIMLSVIFVRCLLGHFKSHHHFAFEAVAWYWHFVDVVWLLLFVVVYWL